MLKLQLQQKLQQKLSPQQILYFNLLQVPTVALEHRIMKELEENPALDMLNNHTDADTDYETMDNPKDETDDILFDEENPEYYHNNNQSEEKTEKVIVESLTFYDKLQQQINELHLLEKEHLIAQYIIGNIEEDGYLRRTPDAIIDDLAFKQNIRTEKKEVLQILSLIQTLEPAGIAALDLRDCLLLQLKRLKRSSIIEIATTIIDKYFDDFSNKRYEKILKVLNIPEIKLKEALLEISKLNPKPGEGGIEETKTQRIIPDFNLFIEDENIILTINSKNAPHINISQSYKDLLEHYQKDKRQKDATSFVKQKLEAAKWFIDAIKQRQQTLLKTMNAIVEYQRNFFISGTEKDLKPMILKDIANYTQLDISTISRVVNSKYIQTSHGIYPLKYFFSEGVINQQGEEISTKEIKSILQKIIENEDKRNPLSDDNLGIVLREKGYNIARRTISKYRELLQIPTARLRKEL